MTQYPLYGRRVNTRAGLDGCGKSRALWDSIPGPSSQYASVENRIALKGYFLLIASEILNLESSGTQHKVWAGVLILKRVTFQVSFRNRTEQFM
jgi:hypothetical protein